MKCTSREGGCRCPSDCQCLCKQCSQPYKMSISIATQGVLCCWQLSCNHVYLLPLSCCPPHRHHTAIRPHALCHVRLHLHADSSSPGPSQRERTEALSRTGIGECAIIKGPSCVRGISPRLTGHNTHTSLHLATVNSSPLLRFKRFGCVRCSQHHKPFQPFWM